MDTHATMIIPARLVDLARALAAGLSGGGAGMFVRGLSATGQPPATHYVSSGFISEQFGPLLTDAGLLHGACEAAGAAVTAVQCEELVASADVSYEDPYAAFERLALVLLPAD